MKGINSFIFKMLLKPQCTNQSKHKTFISMKQAQGLKMRMACFLFKTNILKYLQSHSKLLLLISE